MAPRADTEQTAVTLPAVPRRHPSQKLDRVSEPATGGPGLERGRAPASSARRWMVDALVSTFPTMMTVFSPSVEPRVDGI